LNILIFNEELKTVELIKGEMIRSKMILSTHAQFFKENEEKVKILERVNRAKR